VNGVEAPGTFPEIEQGHMILLKDNADYKKVS